jgi:PleD family two-component response regulator
LEEVTHFFSVYKDLESAETESRGWEGIEKAHAEIEGADVLVVDDSPLVRRIITSLLESNPCIRVVPAAAGEQEAVE